MEKCKICHKKIMPEQEHTGLGFKKSKYGTYKPKEFIGFVHWICLQSKQYLEIMKELPIEL